MSFLRPRPLAQNEIRGKSIRYRPLLESLESRCLLATYTWAGMGMAAAWNGEGNWQVNNARVNAVPTANDDVVIGNGTKAQVIANVNAVARAVTIENGAELEVRKFFRCF